MGRIATVVGIALSIATAYMAAQFNTIMDALQLVFAFVKLAALCNVPARPILGAHDRTRTCFIVTAAISILTRPRPEHELEGLVYSLTKRLDDSGISWYARPAFLGGLVIVCCIALNFRVPVAAMDLDLRVSLGVLFVTLGLIMSIFGLSSDPALYRKSLGINVNLDWGSVELLFGSLMTAFGRSPRETAATTLRETLKSAPGRRKAVTTRQDFPPPVKPRVPHG